MSTYEKAARLLARLYLMWRTDFFSLEVEDILERATSEEIGFYYERLCKNE